MPYKGVQTVGKASGQVASLAANNSSSIEARTVPKGTFTKATAAEAVVSSAVQLLATLRPPISPVKQFCPEQVRAKWLSGAIPSAHPTMEFSHKHCCFQGPCCLQEAHSGHLNAIAAQGVGLELLPQVPRPVTPTVPDLRREKQSERLTKTRTIHSYAG